MWCVRSIQGLMSLFKATFPDVRGREAESSKGTHGWDCIYNGKEQRDAAYTILSCPSFKTKTKNEFFRFN
jgi:hypothetical protein